MSFKFIDKLIDKNVKYYDHYISLRYNCEFAYRFYNQFHFVESSLFTWANSINFKTLMEALSDINIILSKMPKFAGSMWRCVDTNIRFHGIEPKTMHNNPSLEDYEIYQKELVSRISHLKEKFKNQISDNKKTLFTYTYYINKENETDIINNINLLKNTLIKIGANNFEILIVLERTKIPIKIQNDLPQVYIRYVEKFAPENDVTYKKYDKKSWNNIFKEFKPNFKNKKTKKFKFEDV